MNMLLLSADELNSESIACLRDHRARHIHRVLHAQPGQILRAGIVNGAPGMARVEQTNGDVVYVRFEPHGDALPVAPVDLLLALPRPKVMKRLWPVLASLGVHRIMLVNADKVERFYFDSHVLKPAFYTPLLLEGLSQAMDTKLPVVSIHRRFKVLVEDELEALSPDTQRTVADPSATTPMVEAVRRDKGKRILLAIGPEGGWTAYEREMMVRHGFVEAQAGSRILRADTACVALITLVYEGVREGAPHVRSAEWRFGPNRPTL